MIKLITNSDDFGINNSITDAIIETHVKGIMKSTTMMTNMCGFEYAALKAKEYNELGIGIHFNLTEGKPLSPLSKIPDLVSENGYFKNNLVQRKNFIIGRRKLDQIKLELNAQMEKMFDNNIVPTHFDSHHHITGTPLAFIASLSVAKKYKIKKARITNTDFMYSSSYKKNIFSLAKKNFNNLPKSSLHYINKVILIKNGFTTPDTKILPGKVLPNYNNPIKQFINTLSILKPGVTEISFHPGYLNSRNEDSKVTKNLRIRDMKVACSEEVIKAIKTKKIKLINFKEI